jgi:hypothetical protein
MRAVSSDWFERAAEKGELTMVVVGALGLC